MLSFKFIIFMATEPSFYHVFGAWDRSPTPPTPASSLALDFPNQKLALLFLIAPFWYTSTDFDHSHKFLFDHTSYSLDLMSGIAWTQMSARDASI
jgi:hypothetical protein